MLAQFLVENARRGLHFEGFFVELVLLHVLEVVDFAGLIFLIVCLGSEMVLRTFFEFFKVGDPIDNDKAILILAHAS